LSLKGLLRLWPRELRRKRDAPSKWETSFFVQNLFSLYSQLSFTIIMKKEKGRVCFTYSVEVYGFFLSTSMTTTNPAMIAMTMAIVAYIMYVSVIEGGC